jgi:hypothetical protein
MSGAAETSQRLKRTYIILGILAITLVVIGILVPHKDMSPTHSIVTHLILIHFGIGLGVACLVAAIFDRLYHEELIGKPLREIKGQLESAQKDVESFQKELTKLEHSVTEYSNILRMSKDEGIVAIYRRHDREFRNTVIKYVLEAEKFVYTLGRTHRRMLINEGEPGWLINNLVNKVERKKGGLPIKILLPNPYDKESGFRKQLEYRANKGVSEYHATRDTVKGLLKIFDKQPVHDVSIRLTGDAPLYGMVMTEERLFIEHYIPTSKGGTSIVLEIEKHASIYAAVFHDFIRLYERAGFPADVYRVYMDRKTREKRSKALDAHLTELRDVIIPIADFWKNAETLRIPKNNVPKML